MWARGVYDRLTVKRGYYFPILVLMVTGDVNSRINLHCAAGNGHIEVVEDFDRRAPRAKGFDGVLDDDPAPHVSHPSRPLAHLPLA